MDIIAAHQQGLIEQLDEDVRALAGRARDHCQRAVVLHHLYDHSRGMHQWALAEARRELQLSRSLAALEKRIGRWGWTMRGRETAAAALKQLAQAIGETSRERCAAAYRAYRLSATPALQSEAENLLPETLFVALRQGHAARRNGEALAAEQMQQLWGASDALAASVTDRKTLAAAWAAIEATGLKRPARRLIGERALERAVSRDRRRGWEKVERDLRSDPALPAAFRANPAQHFYALQLAQAERRRQQWREACDREPDAFELAA